MVDHNLAPLYKLPAEFNKKIGHAIVGFSYIEFLLSRILYDLLRLDEKEGRLAVREPKATERFTLVMDLLDLNKITVKSDLAKIQKGIDIIQTERNQIAHGIWMEHPQTKQPLQRIVKGSWKPPSAQKKVKKAVKPEGRDYGLKELDKLCTVTDDTTALLYKLASEIVYRDVALKGKYKLD